MAIRRMPESNDHREGYSLVAVLVFCLILVPVIAAFAQSSRTLVRRAHSTFERGRLEFLAAGLADAVAFKAADDRAFYKDVARKGLLCRYDDVTAALTIEDHDGKIDINSAGGDLLRAGFRASGMNEHDAESLQQYAEAFRSGQPLPTGMRNVALLPSIKGAAFERVEEVYDAVAALGRPPVDLTNFFTVYRRSGNVEFETASPDLQRVLRNDRAMADFLAEDNGAFEFMDVDIAVRNRSGLKTGVRKTYRGEPGGRIGEIAREDGIADNGDTRLSVPEQPQVQCRDLIERKPGADDA